MFCYVAPVVQKEDSGPLTVSFVQFCYHIVIKEK